jgi:two-component system sensor histidine kinase BaeS
MVRVAEGLLRPREDVSIRSMTPAPGTGRSRRIGVALTLVGIGVATDQVTRMAPGIGIGLVALVGAICLVQASRPQRPALLLLAGALAFTLLITVRANPLVQVGDLFAAVGLSVMAAAYAQDGVPVPGTLRAWAVNSINVFGALPEGLALFAPRRIHGATGRVSVALRAVVPAAVAFLLFGGLLASADAVFARVLTTPLRWDLNYEQLPQHLVMTLVATIGAATLVAYASTRRPMFVEGSLDGSRLLGRTEWVAALGTVTALFALFVVIQFAYLFGGGSRVLSVPGLSYADYARSGFAQMIAAAALSAVLIGLAWLGRRQDPGRAVQVLSIALLVLNLVVLASAVKRLALYQGALGWTEARFLGFTIILWLAVVLVAAVVAVTTRRAAWLASTAAGVSLALILLMNVVNIDGFITQRNLDRYDATGKIDANYLATLSGDAAPTLVSALDRLSPPDRAIIEPAIRCRAGEADGPWFSWNAGRTAARSAAVSAGISPATDPVGCGVSF